MDSVGAVHPRPQHWEAMGPVPVSPVLAVSKLRLAAKPRQQTRLGRSSLPLLQSAAFPLLL
jgi:hypothetical protein